MSVSLTHQFLAWCRSKPADEEYNFRDFYECACAQFGHDAGLIKPDETIGDSDDLVGLHYEFAPQLSGAPWLFGALADRVERQLAEQVNS